MADAFKRLVQTTLDFNPTVTTLYTAPPLTTTIIRHMRIVNTNISTDRTVKMFDKVGLVPTGINTILPFTTIDAGGWAEFEGTIILEAGQSIFGTCGEVAGEVVVSIYGMETA